MHVCVVCKKHKTELDSPLWMTALQSVQVSDIDMYYVQMFTLESAA